MKKVSTCENQQKNQKQKGPSLTTYIKLLLFIHFFLEHFYVHCFTFHKWPLEIH